MKPRPTPGERAPAVPVGHRSRDLRLAQMRRRVSIVCVVGAAMLAVPWATAAASGGVAAPAADDAFPGVVELPKFEVVDSRLLPPPESWHYAQIPGFEILSNISQSATKRFVDDFLLLQMVIDTIMPGLSRSNVPVPTALILCGRGNAFEQFVPDDQSEARYGKNSLFFANAERAAIVVDFALAEIQLSDNTTEESDPYRGFYLEYFRYLIRRQMSRPPPPWFEEGLVQIFAAMDFNRKWITFAQIGDGFGGPKTGDFNRRLAQRALIPFRDFLEPGRSKERGTFWSAQCYAFVHMCLYGGNKRYQRPFLNYIQRCDTEPVTEDLFKDCFKKTYKEMGLELRGYIDFTNYQAMQYTAKKGQELPKPPAIALEPAPDAVVGRVKGEVLRLAGHGAEARIALIAPYVRGEREPRLLAALGLDEKLAGKDDRARKFLEAAAAAKVDRARAYLELGRLRLAEARKNPGAPKGRLDEGQVTAVLTPLFTARKTPPPMAEVYALIAQTWALSARAPELSHLDVVLEGVTRFPRDVSLVMDATLLAANRGFPQVAQSLAQLGVKVASEPGDQDRFRLLASAFEPGTSNQPSVSPAPESEPPPARTPGPLLPELK